MTADELRTVLATSGIECRVKGEEVIVRTCLRCGNEKWNMELNAAGGYYNCWACKAGKGERLDGLLTEITGQTYHIEVIRGRFKRRAGAPAQAQTEFARMPVAQVSIAARYLARRGMTDEVITAFGLAVCVEKGHRLEGRIVIPALDYWTGALLGWVGRAFSGARPKYLNTLTRVDVTGWQADRKAPCVVVEGHLDGIAIRRAGYSAAVLSGIGGAIAVVEQWAARMPSDVLIVVMLDPEAAEEGRQLFWKIVAVRGAEHTKLVSLSGDRDPGDLSPVEIRELVSGCL